MTPKENPERMDELAEGIITVWGREVAEGRSAQMSAEYQALFAKCRRYRDAKQVADMHRGLGILSEIEAAEEKASRHEFADAYGKFSESSKWSQNPTAARRNRLKARRAKAKTAKKKRAPSAKKKPAKGAAPSRSRR
jgi:hypothetical protein